MRVSLVERDPGYVVDFPSYRVTVDGRRVSAVTADEETGECWVWDRVSCDAGEPRVELLRGDVRVERWESPDVKHPDGTVGFIDEADGFWTWCPPGVPGYENAKARAVRLWDARSRAWVDFRRCVRH